MKDVIIIGAGIAGLSSGLELQKENIDFQILESSSHVGGNIESIKINDYLLETGPYTFTSSNTEVLQLVKELELEEALIQANKGSKKRYVHFMSKLIQVPTGPGEFFKTELLSGSAKRILFEELFIENEEKEETVEDFFSRRFGREVLKNLIQPYVCGVFAGDVQKLSANAVFPELKKLEQKYKSVILGFLLSRGFKRPSGKWTLYSFKDGMKTLPETIHEKLKNKITLNASGIEVTRAKDFFIVSFKLGGKLITHTTNSVLFAVPAYEILNYSHLFPSQHSMELFQTEYLPVAVVSQIIEKSKTNFDLDGFGYLCTKEPHRKILGTIWCSSIFPDRAPSEKALLNTIIGGSYYKKIAEQQEDDIKTLVSKEVAEILKLSSPASLETIFIKVHKKAIPQYHLGHLERVKRIEEVMDKNFGLFFTGNYFYGISLNDTIKTSKTVVEKIKRFLNEFKKEQRPQIVDQRPKEPVTNIYSK